MKFRSFGTFPDSSWEKLSRKARFCKFAQAMQLACSALAMLGEWESQTGSVDPFSGKPQSRANTVP